MSRQISNDSSRFCSICSRTLSNTVPKPAKLQSPTDLPVKARCGLLSPTWVRASPAKNCLGYLRPSTDWARSNRRSRELASALLLLDVHLPDLDGWDVFSQLQGEEATRKIPVIVLSADATARQIQQFMTAGARDYLTKPLDVARFSRVIEESAWPSTDSKTLIQKPNGQDNELIKKI